VAGYSSGMIAVFNLQKAKLLKKTRSVFKNEKVKQVKFLQSDEPKKKGVVVIACNDEGKLMKIFIYKSNNFGLKKTKKQVTPINCKSYGPLLQIQPVFIEFDEKNQKKCYSLICSTSAKVFVHNLETNNSDFELDKPNILNAKAFPFVLSDKTDLLNSFYLLKFLIILLNYINKVIKISLLKPDSLWHGGYLSLWLVISKQ